MLTSRRVVEVIVGPAGTGKTRVLAAAAQAWAKYGDGRVFGTATSQNAANELRKAGVQVTANTTRMLASIRRGRIPAGSLILADEGSMISLQHLSALVSHAARSGCKVVLAGDQEQLAAIEGGGAMMLLADRMGYVQLAEPVRFTAEWERDASLRLRAGDQSALDDYDQHGRICGAPPDEAMDQAVNAYIASYLAGHDVILTAADWARCRELSRRIRGDLIHLGLVDAGRTVPIAEGAQASAGDLIICRDNDHHIDPGEPGRGLANGDVLRIEAITPGGIRVRRLLDPDPATGARRFTSHAFSYHGYRTADLAYATTGHSAQGGTVHTGITLVTGSETRQWLYSALTRGTHNNMAFAFTTPAKAADPQPGTRPAPELERYERIRQERDGFLPAPPGHGPAGQDPREAAAVLADVLGRDGSELSASETRRRNLANADHLGTLNAIWTAETQPAHNSRYHNLVLAALPPGYRQELSHQARWLYRTLRTAELAGLDTAGVIRRAVESRDLAGARDIASILDARIRQRAQPLLPQPQGPWAGRVPQLDDPERQAYLTEIATMMDDRKQRLGQHAASHPPSWALKALGPVLADEPARQDWQRKAATIGAYREMYGYDHPTDPIGPQPPLTPPTCAPPGTRHSSPSAHPAGPTSAACLMAGSGWSATPTPPKPYGPRGTSAGNCGWPGSARITLTATRSAPMPKQKPPASTATMGARTATSTGLPPTRRWAAVTVSRKKPSPPPWTTAANGSTPPSPPATSPPLPTPSCAGVTPASESSPSGPPNPPLPAKPNGTN